MIISFLWTTKNKSSSTVFAYSMLLLLLVFQLLLLQPVESKAYELYSSRGIHALLDELKVKYPNLVRVTTAQEAYGLSSVGTVYDCPFYNDTNGCPNAILTIQDYVKHPPMNDDDDDDSSTSSPSSSNQLPEVLWSGSVHGNERVGPTVVMETALLLLEAATCEASLLFLSSTSSANNHNQTRARQTQEDDSSTTCRTTLAESGIGDVERRWLARLVSTRRIVIVPTGKQYHYLNDLMNSGILFDSNSC